MNKTKKIMNVLGIEKYVPYNLYVSEGEMMPACCFYPFIFDGKDLIANGYLVIGNVVLYKIIVGKYAINRFGEKKNQLQKVMDILGLEQCIEYDFFDENVEKYRSSPYTFIINHLLDKDRNKCKQYHIYDLMTGDITFKPALN